ncbi:TasA family protein [Neobacillus thermocopriae]|uniref:TasA family protein n=1 Tax=Neobacillus thermocopriae TaxID=1215031 RepID=UPI00376FBBB8
MIKKLTSLFLCFLLIFLFSKNTKAESMKKIDIATFPKDILFNVTNLKPGDWMDRTLTIQNNGHQDFNYFLTSEMVNGSDKFYNELQLKVADKDNVLFEGKLKDFNKLEPRFIGKNDSDQLFFTVIVPEELGNDYQGLGCEIQFKLFVEGTLGELFPMDGAKLPKTGTNSFNLIILGAAFVLTGIVMEFIHRRKRITREV